MQEQVELMMLSENDRKKKLADYVRFSCAKGWVIESQNDFNAVMVAGQKCNHTLHALITFVGGIFTFGFLFVVWGIVWAILASTQKQERIMLNVDDYGEIVSQKVKFS